MDMSSLLPTNPPPSPPPNRHSELLLDRPEHPTIHPTPLPRLLPHLLPLLHIQLALPPPRIAMLGKATPRKLGVVIIITVHAPPGQLGLPPELDLIVLFKVVKDCVKIHVICPLKPTQCRTPFRLERAGRV